MPKRFVAQSSQSLRNGCVLLSGSGYDHLDGSTDVAKVSVIGITTSEAKYSACPATRSRLSCRKTGSQS
jgi:hypothetical protein